MKGLVQQSSVVMFNQFEITIEYRFTIGKTKPTNYRLYNRFIATVLNLPMQVISIGQPKFSDRFYIICAKTKSRNLLENIYLLWFQNLEYPTRVSL